MITVCNECQRTYDSAWYEAACPHPVLDQRQALLQFLGAGIDELETTVRQLDARIGQLKNALILLMTVPDAPKHPVGRP